MGCQEDRLEADAVGQVTGQQTAEGAGGGKQGEDPAGGYQRVTLLDHQHRGEGDKRLAHHGPQHHHQPDEDNRMVMARAANLAGKAINISKTTASHALSYTFTSYYGIPHGHAVALTLGEVLLFNSQVNQNDVLDKRGLEHVINTMEELYSMLGCNDALSCKKRIQELLTSCDLEINLADLGIDYQEALELVSNNVNIERLSNLSLIHI